MIGLAEKITCKTNSFFFPVKQIMNPIGVNNLTIEQTGHLVGGYLRLTGVAYISGMCTPDSLEVAGSSIEVRSNILLFFSIPRFSFLKNNF